MLSISERSVSAASSRKKGTEAPCLARDELTGQIVAARLGAGGYRVWRKALPARYARIDALFQHASTEIRPHDPGGDCDIDGRFRR